MRNVYLYSCLALCFIGMLVCLAIYSQSGDVPDLDTSMASVPLGQIHFDTFSFPRSVALSQAPRELIERLRNAIPPLNQPKYQPAEEAYWMNDSDIVIGYASGDSAWAYPIRILNFHEIVNDTLEGKPVVITFCPLCFCAVVYHRQLEGQEITFGNTNALFESDLVMFDDQTGSYWWQMAGRSIVGTLNEKEITVLPSLTATWKVWKDLHPDSMVLSRETGFARDYSSNPFRGYEQFLNQGGFAFPVSDAVNDKRLQPATKVLLLSHNDRSSAYAIPPSGKRVIQEVLDGRPIVVFLDAEGQTAAAFEAVVEGKTVSFYMQDDQFLDRETKSVWNLVGKVVQGERKGQQLKQLPSKLSFWFESIAVQPSLSLYEESGIPSFSLH